MEKTLLCFGLGYCAQVLGRRLQAQGWRVMGTTRSAYKAAALRHEGCEALLFDGRDASDELRTACAQASHVLISAAPDGSGDPVLTARGLTLSANARHWQWLGYLSTTGVYGDKGGGWVDEETRPAPTGPRGARRLAAEIAWQLLAAETGVPLHIFRLPGIYGPGRNPLEALRAGTARRFDKPGQYFSRVHVEDIATTLAASMARPSAGAIYNVCDDAPAPQADVIAYGAELLGIAPPPLNPMPPPRLRSPRWPAASTGTRSVSGTTGSSGSSASLSPTRPTAKGWRASCSQIDFSQTPKSAMVVSILRSR